MKFIFEAYFELIDINFFFPRNFSLEDVHIGATNSIASIAAAQGVDNLVHVSSLSAKGNSPSKLYQLKAQGERVLTDAFPQATVIRPAECYGHEDDYFNRYACKASFL